MKSLEVRLAEIKLQQIQAQAPIDLEKAKLEQLRVSLRMKEVELEKTRLDQENAKKSQDSGQNINF
jgi:hypothetical protein